MVDSLYREKDLNKKAKKYMERLEKKNYKRRFGVSKSFDNTKENKN